MIRLGVVGATGAVGKELFDILEKRDFPIGELRLFGSPRSLGKKLTLRGKTESVRILEPGCFDGLDLIFFDASDAISKEWVKPALESGAIIIDNSAVYRLDPAVPLVVPEVNLQAMKDSLKKGNRLFAGPNCTTVPLAVVIDTLRQVAPVSRVIVSTYQSVSGAGTEAVAELRAQSVDILSGKPAQPKALAHPIAFNLIPQIGGFLEDGSTSEELKVRDETRKILDLPNLPVTCTAVRVPTVKGHGESVLIEFSEAFDLEKMKAALRSRTGITVLDDPKNRVYPMNETYGVSPALTVSGMDDVAVGRVRRDTSSDRGLQLWIVSDNLRKGAALNAIQMAEGILPELLARHSS